MKATSSRSIIALLFAAMIAALSSYATRQQTSDVPPSSNDIAEYQRLVDNSQLAVRQALDALDQVSPAIAGCSPAMLAKFSKEVHRLEIEAIPVRARAQAVLDRGDAYFENWKENLAQVEDAQVRELVDQHHLELQQRFSTVKRLSQQSRDSFRLFLSGLRGVRNTLEKDLDALQADPMRDLIRTTKEHGRHVEESLAMISQELQTMRALVTPTSATATH
jgi:hypothetical protein